MWTTCTLPSINTVQILLYLNSFVWKLSFIPLRSIANLKSVLYSGSSNLSKPSADDAKLKQKIKFFGGEILASDDEIHEYRAVLSDSLPSLT